MKKPETLFATRLIAFRQPALVETMIAGQALSIGVVGNLPAPAARSLPADKRAPAIFQGLQILPPVETITSEKDGGFLAARKANFKPVPLVRSQARALKWLAAAAFRVTGCLDVAVIRFRIEAQAGDRPYILEVEPLPNLEPERAPLSRAAKAAGWSYEELINRILVEALARFRPASQAGNAPPPSNPANRDKNPIN